MRQFLQRRELRRLARLPRYESACTGILGGPLRLVDAQSFLVSWLEIFQHEIYWFKPARATPVILDCGANVGLATLYWKQLYPAARIVAFEPDPAIFDALTWNCRSWGVTDVELVSRAVWEADSEMAFWPEGAHAGRLLPRSTPAEYPRITVRTVRLRDFLETPIDLLKLDVEGAEATVMLDCADRLVNVERVFVEYHSFVDQPQRIGEMLSVLAQAGLRVHLQPQLVSLRPFRVRPNVMGMDQSVNVFAYRD